MLLGQEKFKEYSDLNPLTKDEVTKLLNLLELEQSQTTIPDNISSLFMFQLISKRTEFFKVEFSPYLIVFLSCICDSPGIAVMYINYIMYRSKQDKVNLNDFCFIFPSGIPKNKDLNLLWDIQKMKGGGNLMDMCFVESGE